MTRTPEDPPVSALTPVAPHRAALVTPGGPAIPNGPHPGMAGGTDREDGPVPAGRPSLPGSLLEPAEPGPSSPLPPCSGPQEAAAGIQTPAGSIGASPVLPAGSQALSGAEWRKAVKAAQSKARRKTTRPAAASRPAAPSAALPAAPPGTAVLVATASCTGCEWTAGPGSAADVDRAAETHTGVGHSTAVSAELGGAA